MEKTHNNLNAPSFLSQKNRRERRDAREISEVIVVLGVPAVPTPPCDRAHTMQRARLTLAQCGYERG